MWTSEARRRSAQGIYGFSVERRYYSAELSASPLFSSEKRKLGPQNQCDNVPILHPSPMATKGPGGGERHRTHAVPTDITTVFRNAAHISLRSMSILSIRSVFRPPDFHLMGSTNVRVPL